MRRMALLAMMMLCSCGGKQTTNDPSMAGTSGGGSRGSAGDSSIPASDGRPPDMCEGDWECEGHPCVEIYPGHTSCIIGGGEASNCDSELDECCSSSDCTDGKCYGLESRSVRCKDFVYHNACATDECTAGSCGPGRACMPAGVLGPVAMCTKAACQTDGDCDAEPGGLCALVADSCCNGASLGLFCWYPSRGCWWDGNCDLGFCGIAANGTDSACHGSLVCPD
jgi:hypothetical protein